VTDDELKAIEAQYTKIGDVGRLVAEVRRLKGLVRSVENQGATGRDSDPACPWCGAQTVNFGEPHHSHCEAFTPEGHVR
jgi:hypothetical protein